MNILRTTLISSLLVLLVACQSDLDLRYLDASVGGSLELPPDLSRYEAVSSSPVNTAGSSNLDSAS